MILDDLLKIDRITKDSDNVQKEQYVANAALQSVKCNIQPASNEATMMIDGVFGQTYTAFTTESGVMTGDKATSLITNKIYRIKGKEDWSGTDIIPHYELTLVEFEEEEV